MDLFHIYFLRISNQGNEFIEQLVWTVAVLPSSSGTVNGTDWVFFIQRCAVLSACPPSSSAVFTCTGVLPSEVVDEHGHTVGSHQVVGVSGQRIVLPVFGIGCSETKKKKKVAE